MPKKKPLKPSAIVFIDGNNLYHTLKDNGINPKDIDILKLSNYVCDKFGCFRKSTIYYNSTPDIREGPEKYYGHMKFLKHIERLPRFEVKTRKLQKNSNKEILSKKENSIKELDLCKNCKPIVTSNCQMCVGDFNTKEKGVDVMIAVDMINLSVIGGKCDYCIIISGDADFIPSMDLIKKAGKIAVSAALPKGYSNNLRDAHGWHILDRTKILEACSSYRQR